LYTAQQTLRGDDGPAGADHHGVEVEAEGVPAERAPEQESAAQGDRRIGQHADDLRPGPGSVRRSRGQVRDIAVSGHRVHQRHQCEDLDEHAVGGEHGLHGERTSRRRNAGVWRFGGRDDPPGEGVTASRVRFVMTATGRPGRGAARAPERDARALRRRIGGRDPGKAVPTSILTRRRAATAAHIDGLLLHLLTDPAGCPWMRRSPFRTSTCAGISPASANRVLGTRSSRLSTAGGSGLAA
jgi:hypothetical protein